MEYSVYSDRGTREVNEDCVGVEEAGDDFCCALADGLGGHDRGEVASKLVTDVSLELFRQRIAQKGAWAEDFIKECFQTGQDRLLRKQEEANSDMKTTLVVLTGFHGKLQWGHIGDSRLYYFKDRRLTSRTLDHSVPQMLVRTGEIKEKEIRFHEDRNQLLRVMGTPWDRPKYEVSEPVPMQEGQAFLLCTDGFWEWIDEKQMARCLRRAGSPKEWLDSMAEEIRRKAGGQEHDNFTAAAVFIGGHARKKGLFAKFLP